MIDDETVEKLRWDIIHDLHAADAARELLHWAWFCIETGTPAPQTLRRVIADGLEHLEWNDPLRAFGHIYNPAPRKRGRPRKESDEELLHVLQRILRVHEEGFPLVSAGERWPFKRLDGTAFVEYARRTCAGNDYAVQKEARRLQAAFWKHVEGLQFAQQEAIGLVGYLPRKKS